MRLIGLGLVSFGLLAAVTAADLLRQAEEHIQKERFSTAEPILEQAVKIEPGNVSILYRLGYVQYRQRKLSQARRNFTAAVKAAPPAYHSRYFLGRICLLEGKPDEAVVWLEPVAESGQTVFDAHSQLASAYAGAGKNEKAIASLHAAINEAPWNSALYYRLGQLHRHRGQGALAQDAFGISTRLRNASREDVETLMRVGQAIGEGNTDEALGQGRVILDRDSADPNVLVALGVLYGNANRQREAQRAFERAAGADAHFFQAQFNYGLALLKGGRASEALAPLKRAVELLPQSQEANITYGLACVMTQRYGDAAEPLDRAWKHDPSNARVGALLATAYLRTGAAAQAVRILRQVSAAEVRDPAPLLLLVEALNATEDTNGALEAAREAQKRFPGSPQAHMAVAQQLARLGRYQEARPHFAMVLKLAPGFPEAELGMADTLQRGGEHAGAADHYRASMKSQGTALAARVGLARSLVALRKLDEARLVLEEGLPLHPEDVSLRLELSRVYARLGKPELAAEQTKMLEKLRAAQPVR